MAKMFYTLEEASDKLNMTEDQIKELVRNAQLREFRDAGKINYKVDEVDALVEAADPGASGGSGELVLEPAEDSGAGGTGLDLAGASSGLGSDVLTLDEADMDGTAGGTKAEGDKKDDTVVTSVGVNVFDDDDELADVDPLAQTVVTEGAAGLGLEGIGSGSGLLDLTRESDDTSLGADLLDEIYPDEQGPVEMGDATRAGLEEAIVETPEAEADEAPEEIFEPVTEEAAGPAVRTRTVVEYGPDAISTGLTGMIVVATAVMCVAGLGAAATMQGVWPSLLDVINHNMWIFGAASAGLAAAAMGVGFVLGKRTQG
ncbi:MAG: helix-turn-helix domain-containing protein [bacterium]|nr:helix-turn-helix domain-containing protein [bacterium]